MSNRTNSIGEAQDTTVHEDANCCKSAQQMKLEDSLIPLQVKKIGDLNGMSLPKNFEQTLSPCESEPQGEHSPSSANGGELQDREEHLANPVATLQTSSSEGEIQYVGYQSELQMGAIMALITKDLSEPYSIYTYRYFIHNWPNLCFLAMHENQCVGAIVCKLDVHKNMVHRGYIAMLAVEKEFRRHKIGTKLVKQAIKAMIEDNCDEVVLETEITNKGALHLYEKLGFVRDKRLFRYYLNGVDALRLKLWLR